MPQGELVTQTEDVLVDRRGYLYISDKNQGLWVPSPHRNSTAWSPKLIERSRGTGM
jgi:myo-inositol-hexaphosphate 3-phosphohydrolase